MITSNNTSNRNFEKKTNKVEDANFPLQLCWPSIHTHFHVAQRRSNLCHFKVDASMTDKIRECASVQED